MKLQMNKKLINWLKKNYESFSKKASEIATPLPKDTLKSMMADIKQNLAEGEEPRIGELPQYQKGAGKKSNKRYTKNKKNKARKTRKNKPSLKKKAHKKK